MRCPGIHVPDSQAENIGPVVGQTEHDHRHDLPSIIPHPFLISTRLISVISNPDRHQPIPRTRHKFS